MNNHLLFVRTKPRRVGRGEATCQSKVGAACLRKVTLNNALQSNNLHGLIHPFLRIAQVLQPSLLALSSFSPMAPLFIHQ